MALADLRWPLEQAVAQHRDRLAVTAGGRSVTYGELGRRARALGAALADLGVAPGERVAFLGANSLAHLEAWLAVPGAGRVLCDLNLRLAAEELAFLVDDCEAQVLIHDAANAAVARELLDRCPSLRTLILDAEAPAAGAGGPAAGADGPTPDPAAAEHHAAAADGVETYEHLLQHGAARMEGAPQPEVGPDTLAAISYTGGTTGRPKGVMLSHHNLAANALHNLIITGHRSDDVFLHVCPMFHVAGTANVFAATWAGARQVVLPRFAAADVATSIEAERVTLTTLVPTMLAMLLAHLEQHPADLSSLRNLHYAASPISPALQRRVCQTLDCEIAQMYGMTEAAPTVTHLSPEVHRLGIAGHEPEAGRLASMGRAVPGVRAEVRDGDGRRLGPGEIGEVWVQGPNIMLGYWRRPEATASALADGWYRTGDAAYADADGYLFMVDRLKDMIITGGENVYSIEVEKVLTQHAGVQEAAVFGVPDPRWGERVHAQVCLAPGAEVAEAELEAFCRARIAGFKVPRSWTLSTDPLPKSGAGKVLKTVLREPYWRGVGRHVT